LVRTAKQQKFPLIRRCFLADISLFREDDVRNKSFKIQYVGKKFPHPILGAEQQNEAEA
jgi:hypothetical protein